MSRYLSAVQRALPMPINTAMFACAGTFTWVCPPGVYRVQAIVAGAGGGGGALTTNNYGGGGGGAGGASLAYVDVVPGIATPSPSAQAVSAAPQAALQATPEARPRLAVLCPCQVARAGCPVARAALAVWATSRVAATAACRA